MTFARGLLEAAAVTTCGSGDEDDSQRFVTTADSLAPLTGWAAVSEIFTISETWLLPGSSEAEGRLGR